MQRFSTWASWIIGIIFGSQFALEVFRQVAQRIGLYDRPREAFGTVLNFFLSLAELPWLRNTLLLFGGLAAGFLLKWLLQRLDGSRAKRREALGDEMAKLGNYLGQIKFPFPTKENARIMSCFASAKKFGIWVPDDRAFPFQAARARSLITDYLSKVGQMLSDGNFREAKQYAKKSKADFDSIA
jgi:hypothetical protein